ncbi:MAG: glycosyltransferase [Pseudomonadales bacterium]|nr:glycosyltransferase [Pseudomonadales bacterium]
MNSQAKPGLLIITPEPVSGASSRLRAIDFIPCWCAHYQVRHLSFLSERSYQLKDKQGLIPQKIASLVIDLLMFLPAYFAALYHSRVVFIHRNIAPFGPPWLETIARWAGKRVVYDFDDAIFINPDTAVNQWLAPLKMNAYRTRKLVRLADQVIVGNANLADYAKDYNPKVEIIPTTVNLAAYNAAAAEKQLATQKLTTKNTSTKARKIVIGWIGGPGTASFIEEKMPLLKQLLAQYEHLRIELVGIEKNFHHPYITTKPWQLKHELQDLCGFDIGINPLADNRFTRGKCGFKNIQYMALGIACISSPVGVCAEQIQHGSNGLLATTDDQWREALIQLINNPQLRASIAKQAKIDAQRYDRSIAAEQLSTLFAQR